MNQPQQPAAKAQTFNTAGMGQARAAAVRGYVQQHAVSAPSHDRAILNPDRRQKVITR